MADANGAHHDGAMLAALLQPPRTLDSELITPPDVGGTAAWRSLVLDGQLTPVWGSYAVSAHVEVTTQHRVGALRNLVQSRTTLGRQSALWVHTGRRLSDKVHLLYAPKQHRPKPRTGVMTHQTNLTESDCLSIVGVQVTGPTRTAVDLAIHIERSQALEGLHTLADLGLITLDEVLTRLQQIPGRSRRAESVDLVHCALGQGLRSMH